MLDLWFDAMHWFDNLILQCHVQCIIAMFSFNIVFHFYNNYYYLVCSATWWKNGRNTHLKEIFNCDHEHLIPPEYLLAFYRGVAFLNWSIQTLSYTDLSFGYWVIEPQNHKGWNNWHIFCRNQSFECVKVDHDGLDATMIWCGVSIVQIFDSLKEVTFINDGDGPIIIASNIIQVHIGNNGLKKKSLKGVDMCRQDCVAGMVQAWVGQKLLNITF